MAGETERQAQRVAPEIAGANPTAMSLARAGGELAVRWWILASAQDGLPIALVAGIAFGSFFWNAHVGLIWAPRMPLSTLLIITIAFSSITAMFSTVWSNRIIVELATYYTLWANFPYFAVRLNYLAETFNFPLQDGLFTRADLALGFDWRTWVNFVWSHHALIDVLTVAYDSMYYQCFALVAILAIWGPRGRNRELLTATIFAFLLTVAISTVLPALGVCSVHGIPSPWETILRALRAGIRIPLPYAGIVSFPSFHASMVVLLTAATRDSRWGFVAALVVNGLMLLSTLPIGDHFLVDVIAGCVVGFGSLWAARRIEDRTSLLSNRLDMTGAPEATAPR